MCVFVLNSINYFFYKFRQANLLEWLKKLQTHYHSPIEFKRYDLCITNGSMEGLSKVFELVLNPTDPILVDSPCYSGSLDFVCNKI
jgi:kynurenine/2-aminoadipate aminotransferase